MDTTKEEHVEVPNGKATQARPGIKAYVIALSRGRSPLRSYQFY